jgi:hypothetical protein
MRLAYDWAVQAHLIAQAYVQCQNSLNTLASVNDGMISMLDEMNALDKIDPQLLASYAVQRKIELSQAIQLGSEGMKENGRLAISDNYANKGMVAGKRSAAARSVNIRNQQVWADANRLLSEGRESRDLASMLSKKHKLSTSQIRRILSKKTQ